MTSRSRIPLAIIGMGCKLPGADNLDEFWRLVVEGRTAVAELPPDRLDQDMYYDPKMGVVGKTYSKMGAIVKCRDFDRAACPIADELANSVDASHLLMCEVAAAALRHAGIDPFNVPIKNTGVYIGHAQGSTLGGEYTYATYAHEAAEMLREVDEFAALPQAEQDRVIAELVSRVRAPLPIRTAASPDVACSLVAGTLTKAFGLNGPFLALNSACASSLQAMLIGGRALQLGRADMVIVGGASDCKGDSLVLFAHARAMSSTGSRPFDADADGLIVGEGYVALVMKTLERALADGDPIRAVVRGLGVSSDGKGKSLWAPRKEGQVLAMQRAYRDGLQLGDLDYVEAHATATQLGDATELNTLAEVLAGQLPPGKKVPITSVKANIGHTLETAGIAGVIKTVLALGHNTVPPAANVSQLNPKIEWDQVPVFVPRAPAPWAPHPDGRPRRAGVNAFGIGGLNMHVAVEEFNEASRRLIALPENTMAGNQPQSADDDAIAVIGMGCVLPGARHTDQYWELLVSGRDPKCEAPPERWRADLAYEPGSRRAYHSPTKRGGFITDFVYDWKTHKIPPKQVEQADPLQFMLLDAADQAIKQAGYDRRDFDRTRVGVVVGTEFGGDFAFQLQMGLRLPELKRHIAAILRDGGAAADRIETIQKKYDKRLLANWPALIDETGSFSTSSLASRTAKTWNLMGGAVAIDSGHCSSLAALSVSVDALLCGDVDMMICAAGQRRLGLPEYEGLAINGALCADGAPSSPLDQAAHGYVPAEGVGVVLLKRLADARRDGDPIVAVVRGIGAAHHANAGAALRVSIERSLAAADRAAADIGLMEVDGAMSVDEGADQLRTLSQLHTVADRDQPLMLSSVAGQIGHAEAAAGMASLIKASLELDRGILPRPVDVRQPIASDGLITPTTQTSVAEIASEGALAAVCSRSRGLTYHVLIESGKAVSKPARGKTSVKQSATATNAKSSPAPKPAAASPVAIPVGSGVVGSRVLTFAADSAEGLVSELTAACGRAADLFAQGSERPFQLSDRFRAAIVADTPQSLAAKLELAVKQGSSPAGQAVLRQQGIYLSETPRERPRVVFCFPGQGSQYPGMLKLLVEQSPAARRALDEVEAILERYGYQSFSDLAWGDSAAMGKQVWPTQLAMLIANWVMFQTVQSVGIVPDAVLGHSFGEYSALAASGAIDIETAIALTRARCDGIAAARVQGGLLATGGSAQRVAELAQQAGLAIHVANFNTPDQTVVGGAPEDLTRFEAILKGAGIGAKLLAVPAPFHTPLMAPASKPLERALAEAQFSNPRVPFWSVVTNRSVTTADEARDNLSRHNTSPVMYVDLIHSVSAGQPCVLVEVGPQQVLSGLHRRILDSTDQVAIACDQPKRPGLEQIEQVRAALSVMGVFDMEHGSPQPLPGGRGARPPRREPLLAFDATTRRRERMRQTAQSGGARAARTAAPVSAPPKPVAQAAGPAPPPPRPAPAAPVAQNGHAPHAVTPHPAPVAKAPSTVDLERFLINFVVEQTGYPPEVVELDADLEADLGIDSIKKAQLFGELQEYFDVVPTEELTLDQFPTLRHVLEFLRTVPMKGAGLEEVAAAAPVRSAAPTPAPAASPAPAAAPAAPGVDELERFLINFVVEQTGYPPEVVELDADLEADLGIDSIKKAQLFGELQEYFDVVPTEELTLDQFPTLRHVFDFLRTVPIRATASLSLPESATAPQAEPPPVTAPAPQPAAAASASAPNVDELERFLINFVVEQTGYPPEVVELDADLEADLGIDSIKKAQLFGELQEYFDVVPTEELTLDQFPTLRHVLDFLRTVPFRASAPFVASMSGHETNGEATAHPFENAVGATDTIAPTTAVTIEDSVLPPTYDLSPSAPTACEPVAQTGTPYEMGLAHGRHYRQAIRQILRTYADLGDLACVGPAGGDSQQRFTDQELDELQGIADGAEVPLAGIMAHQNAAFVDVGQSSLQFAAREASDTSLLHAAAWTGPLMAAFDEVLQPAVFIRRPLLGVEHALVGLVGTVGGIAGVNAEGLTASAAPLPGQAPAEGWARTVARALTRGRDVASALEAADASPSVGILLGSAAPTAIHYQAPSATSAQTADDVLVVALGVDASPLAAARSRWEALATQAQAGHYPVADLVRDACRAEATIARQEVAIAVADRREDWSHLSVVIDPGKGLLWIGEESTRLPDHWKARIEPKRPTAGSVNGRAAKKPKQSPPTIASTPRDPLESMRFTMRTIPMAFAANTPAAPVWQGAALILGDNPVAEALLRQCQATGAAVHRITRMGNLAEMRQQVEAFWAQGPVAHLFLLSHFEATSADMGDPAQFDARLESAVVAPFFLTQAWTTQAVARKWLDRSTVVALTCHGGDLGFGGQTASPEGGALAGLIKALCIEFKIMRDQKNLLVKAIDAPADEPAEALAKNILRELAARSIDYEVAFRQERRYLQNAIPARLADAPRADRVPQGNWIVTGGARGITAECARELAKRFDVRLHLLGTSPLPNVPAEWLTLDENGLRDLKSQVILEAQKAGRRPTDAWAPVEKAIEVQKNLNAFRAAGIAFDYYTCSVTDREALARVLEEVRRSGPITGVLHGAGIERSGKFEKKSPELVAATLGAKVTGAYNLMTLTQADSIRHFVGFGSISGRLGSNGQADYCAASDMLAKLSGWYRARRPDVRSITFHWHPWDEVGMAYRPETRATFQMTDAPELMPKRDGLAHLIRELAADADDTEALITSREFFERYYGPGSADHPFNPSAAIETDEVAAVESSGGDVARRFVLTLEESPLDRASRDVALEGTVCVLGDNADADAIAQMLTASSVTVQHPSLDGEVDEVLARLDAQWSAEPAVHLMLVTARDPDAMLLDTPAAIRRRRERGMVLPFLVTQRWLKRLSAIQSSAVANLVAVTNLGGDFGIASTGFAPEGGALAGLVKSVHVEGARRKDRAIRCRVIDLAASESPQQVGEAVVAELAAATNEIEVAWQAGRRFTTRVTPREIGNNDACSITPGSVWVVTGGARGITAATALHLGKKYGLKLHLVGVSPLSPADAPWLDADDARLKEIKQEIVRRAVADGRSPEEDWARVKKGREIHATLEKFRAAQVVATYHSCDVSNWEDLSRVLDQVRSQDGPIAGVIHGAGYAKSARLEMKGRALIERTLAPKFDGALALMALTRHDPVRHFLSFGSISGRYGGNGLSDYAAANEVLAKLGSWHRGERPDCATASIAWQTWDEIGMAMLSDSVPINRNSLAMKYISPSEGVRHCERELAAALPTPEVVVTDGYFEGLFYGEREQSAATIKEQSPPALPSLIASVQPGDAPHSSVAELRLNPEIDPFLIEHILRGAPFLPGVLALEAMAQAASAATGQPVVAVRNFEIVQGIKCQPQRSVSAHVRLSGDGPQRDARLTVEVRNRKGLMVDPARACASGRVELGSRQTDLAAAPMDQPAVGWLPFVYADNGLLYHGHKLRALKEFSFDYQGGFARIVAPPLAELAGPRGEQGWIFPSAVLDACVVACGSFIFLQFSGRLELPHRIGCLRLARQPRAGEMCMLRFHFRSRAEKHSVFDFTLYGESGDVILDVAHYTTVLAAEKAI